MPIDTSPGLGELLRHLVELTDGANDSWYREQGLTYRPRYTPIMRVLAHGAATVSEIQEKLAVTQGAVSQTLKLMREDGIIERHPGEDARQSVISLSTHGQELLQVLEPHWEATFAAIRGLEKDIQIPLLACLNRSVVALGERSFTERIRNAGELVSRDRKVKAKAKAKAKAGKNPFASGGARYAAFRPSYPAALAESLAAVGSGNDLALDVGCGSGQLTTLLSPHFKTVVGIDPSASQLEHAQAFSNATYQLGSAEDTGLPADSVDLITVAQAAHWFDLDRFYAEARRVAKPEATIALISYGVPYIADPANAIFQQGYWQDVHRFWPAERTHVETGYANLYFPFPAVEVPAHNCRGEMNVEQFISYITTWSAYTRAGEQGERGSFENFFDRLRAAWRDDEIKEVIWPVSIKAGRISRPRGGK